MSGLGRRAFRVDTMHKLRLRGGVGNVRVVKEQQ